ncbi:Oxidoreductase [Ascosphaera atra]|nr:Oxidoreductase [Ascosphaera atra]
MFRSATRTALRAASRPVANAQLGLPARRFASTSPSSTSRAAKPSTWRSTLVRWGLAGALVYYYNTSPAFAEEPQFSVADKMGISKEPSEPPEKRTIQAILDERKHKSFPESEPLQTKPASPEGDASSDPSSGATPGEPSEDSELLTPGELHDEASSQGAFNEETGEINWDCPCLGGMAHGPCGEEFKAAFSCFVYSKEEPKGMDCIEKFKYVKNAPLTSVLVSFVCFLDP